APLHEFVALTITLEFQFHVEIERIVFAVVVDHHRVIHHEIDRHQRLNTPGVKIHALRSRAHGCNVSQERNTGEALKDYPRYDDRNFGIPFVIGLPAGQLASTILAELVAVATTQDRSYHHADGYL